VEPARANGVKVFCATFFSKNWRLSISQTS